MYRIYDSDDWIEENMYQMMMNAIEVNKADICECAFEKTLRKCEKRRSKRMMIKYQLWINEVH